MKINVVYILLLISVNSALHAQNMQRQSLSKQEITTGMWERYESAGFEYYFELILYKNHRFHYQFSGNFGVMNYSDGNWKIQQDIVKLDSDFDSSNVPVKIYFDTDPKKVAFEEKSFNENATQQKYRTRIRQVVNLKGEPVEAMIYVNHDSSFYVPELDTCIGNCNTIRKIQVHFNGGFKSRWINMVRTDFKEMLIVLQIDNQLYSSTSTPLTYKCFRNYRFRKVGSLLKDLNP